MSQRSSHFGFRSRNALYGVFDDFQALRTLSSGLMDAGFGEAQVQILSGEQGVRDLDQDGHHHGLVARWLRFFQSFTDEREHVDRYVQELQCGHHVVSVHLSGASDELTRLCTVFKASGGHYMHHYTPYLVEELSA